MSDIVGEIEQLKNFRVISQTYQEVAAMRMRRTKDQVLRNREFLSGLSEVFSRVKLSYEDKLREILEAKGISDEEQQNSYIGRMNFTQKNGRDVIVFVSANTGLYGDIIRKVFNYFSKHVDSSVDVAILGSLGKVLFQERFPGRDFLYYDLSDGNPDPEEVYKIMAEIGEYENILLFHGKFKNILEQEPVQSSVTGESVAMEVKEDTRRVYCIFEPSLEEVFEFFESEIKKSLFEHALYESSLSKYTSRMVSLDRAATNASKKLDKLRLKQLLLKHREAEKEKNTLLSGVIHGR